MADLADNFYAELTARIRPEDLYAPFAGLLRQLCTNLEARGARFYATSGLRSVEAQDALYARGRDPQATDFGHVVTKAKGGYSAHNYGVGTDLAHDLDVNRPGLQPDYAAASYDVLGEEAAALGLEWGGTWTGLEDRPHVQLPLKARGLTWDVLLRLYRKGGLPAVWERLDREAWGPAADPGALPST